MTSTVQQKAVSSDKKPYELKGLVSTLTVLRLKTNDLEEIDRHLEHEVQQLPHFFLFAPVAVDCAEVNEQHLEVSFERLASILRRHKLVPVAARNIDDKQRELALEAGLGILRAGIARSSAQMTKKPATEQLESSPKEMVEKILSDADGHDNTASQDKGAGETTSTSSAAGDGLQKPGLVVKQAVRGGQVIYAQQRDLIVIGAVNAGAEIIADGNIHVYGPLRGRALAGAAGDASAQIFCTHFDGELVSIAGHYRRAEEIPSSQCGKSTQVYFVDEKIELATL